jgi:prepilin peptidase CpaA
MTFTILHVLFWAAGLTALLASAWTDLKDRIIPNELAGAVAISGLALCLMARPGQAWISVTAAIAVLFGLGVLAHFNLIGGGDVKLISATTLLVPPAAIGQLLLAIVLAGGAVSCVYLVARLALRNPRSGRMPASADAAGDPGALSEGARGWFSAECTRIASGGPMPYGLAILGGVAGYVARELPQCISATPCSL